jgi:ribosomal protein L21E
MNTYIIYVIYREKSNQIVQRDKRDQRLAKLNTTLNTLPAGTGRLQRDKRDQRLAKLNTTLNTLPAGTGCLQRDKRVRR